MAAEYSRELSVKVFSGPGRERQFHRCEHAGGVFQATQSSATTQEQALEERDLQEPGVLGAQTREFTW